MQSLIIFLAVILILLIISWIGLRIKPKPFKPFSPPPKETRSLPLPDDLPAPVERFYRQVYGERVPDITSAVVSGRARLRLPSKRGITFPARFRFIHEAGKDYRHVIQVTFFGLPLFTVNEYYLDNRSRMELPFSVSEGSKVDQGANLALWAEAMWFPSLWVGDPRARWQAIDDETALLTVPYREEQQRILVRFDPETSLLGIMESMRFKGQDQQQKTLWLNEALAWKSIDGKLLPTVGAVTWFDESKPWAFFTVDEVVYNINVETPLQEKGE